MMALYLSILGKQILLWKLYMKYDKIKMGYSTISLLLRVLMHIPAILGGLPL